MSISFRVYLGGTQPSWRGRATITRSKSSRRTTLISTWSPFQRKTGPLPGVGLSLGRLRRSRRLVDSATPRPLDAVYASTPHLLTPLMGLAVARIRRVPLIVEVRDLWPESFVAAGLPRGLRLHKLLQSIERFVCAHADAVVGVTPGSEGHMSMLGVRKSSYEVIPNGADVPDRPLRPPSGLPVAVFTGAQAQRRPGSGHCRRRGASRQLHFLLLGDGPMKATLKARVATLGLTNVEFREPVPKDHLMDVLETCTIGIHSVSDLPVFSLGISFRTNCLTTSRPDFQS